MRGQRTEDRGQKAESTSPRPSPSAPNRPSSGDGGSARAAKTDLRVVRCAERLAMDEKLMAEAIKAVIEAGVVFLTRKGLAVLLKASVRTVDEMVANNELRVMRPGGVLVRFYLPHVVEDLEKAAAKRLQEQKEGA
jgi:excisionase family DNA binding protein